MVKKFFAKAYLYLLLALLYAPIVLIIVFSFFNTSIFSFDNGFSFESYKSIFASDKTPELLAALKKHTDYRRRIERCIDAYRHVFGNRHLLFETACEKGCGKRQPTAHHQQRNRYGGVAYDILRNVLVPSGIFPPYHRTHQFLHAVRHSFGSAETSNDGQQRLRSRSRPWRQPVQGNGKSHSAHTCAQHYVGIYDGVHTVDGRLHHHANQQRRGNGHQHSFDVHLRRRKGTRAFAVLVCDIQHYLYRGAYDHSRRQRR